MNESPEIPDLEDFSIGGKTPLAFEPGWPDGAHEFTRREAVAIQAALLSGRPLLIEGAPGSGKTQIAAAAAAVLRRELITFVVDVDTRPEDLLWRHDALQRLNDAQDRSLKKIEHYLAKGPLWQALDDGEKHADIPPAQTPYRPTGVCEPGKVVLIDEIDKADRGVPNSLLEVFGHRRFYCPHLKQEIEAPDTGETPPLLVIVTSNREQQLPPAFVRRCLVLRIDLPDEREAFIEQLARRAEMHYAKALDADQYREIAEVLWNYRKDAGLSEELQPGQAEYLDLVRAIDGALRQPAPRSFDELLADMQGLAFDKSGRGDGAHGNGGG